MVEVMSVEPALKECQVFSTLSGTELAKIAALSAVKEYDAGSIIIQGGSSAEELLLIEEGRVAIQVSLSQQSSAQIRRMTVDLVTRNEVISWSAIIEPYVHTVSAVALQKVKALAINGAKLRRLLQDDHKIGDEVLKELVKVATVRLNNTRQILVSERLLASKAE